MKKILTEDSYAKNLMADSGKILATERPLPVQNARTPPPSEYIRVMAFAMTLTPVPFVPRSSGGRVMRKILSRSNGAVHVRETIGRSGKESMKKGKVTHLHLQLHLQEET